MAHETMAAGFVDGMARYALSVGVDEQALFAGSDLSPRDLASPEKPIALDSVSILWANATRLSGDPAFSLHLGEASACSGMSILGMLGESCVTFGEALEQVCHFSRLADNRGPTLSVDEAFASVAVNTGSSNFGKALAENNFARMVTGVRREVDCDFELERVCFQHPEPAYLKEYSRVFAAPIFFNEASSSITFQASFLAAPIRDSNPYLNEILSQRASQMFENPSVDETLSAQVAEYVTRHLHAGSLSAPECSQVLGMSRQTLHRKLKSEGTSFRQTVETTRKRLAAEYLENGNLSVSEVAYLLGFAEASSFNRAFKRWTGATPTSARN